MNTLAHVGALLSSLWLSVFSFDTLGNTYLGTAFVVVFFFVVVSTLRAVEADWREFQDR